MDLKDFVSAAITDLASAVKEADAAISSIGGLLNPGSHKFVSDKSGALSGKEEFVYPRTTLKFDIAVSATSSTKGNVGAKAKIFVIEANIGGEGETSSQTISRLSFSIDVVFPAPSDQRTRVGLVARD